MVKSSYVYRNSELNLDVDRKIQMFKEIYIRVEAGEKVIAVCREMKSKYHLSMNARAINMAFNRFSKNGQKFDHRCLCSADEELMLVHLLEAFSLINRSLDRATFLEYVAKAKKLGECWDGSCWFSKFLKRHNSRLGVKTLKGLASQRYNPSSIDAVKDFIKDFETLVKEYKIMENNWINADETRICFNIDKMVIRGIESKRKVLNSFLKPTKNAGATYIPFISRSSIQMQVLIFPTKNVSGIKLSLTKTRYYTTRSKIPTYYCTSETGYANSSLWILILEKFAALMKNKFQNQNYLLLIDNLSCHCNIEVINMCKKNNIHLLYLPPYTTHYLQPLDQFAFANLKNQSRVKFRRNLISASKSTSPSLDLLENLKGVTNSISESTIARSWQETGIIPWNPTLILQKAKNVNGDIKAPTAFDIVGDMFVNILNDLFYTSDTEVFPIPKDINKVLIAEEFIKKMQEQKDKSKQINNSNVSKKRTRKNLDEVPLKKSINSLENNVLCCFGSHNKIGSSPVSKSTKWKHCRYRCGFKVCLQCFKFIPEYLIYHEETCQQFLNKIKANPTKKQKN